MTSNDLLSYGVLGLVAVRLGQGLRHSLTDPGRARARLIVRGIRWRHIWPIPLVLGAILAVSIVLVQVPILRWGWWTSLGGEGNPVTGATSATAGTALEWLIPLVFMVLLAPTLPLFAQAEERMFRLGADRWTWPKRLWKQLAFGMIHALIGIPLGAALALSLGGCYFLARYLQTMRRTGSGYEALLDATRAHTAYNAVILGLVAAVSVAGAVGALNLAGTVSPVITAGAWSTLR